MNVELVYDADCPNVARALSLLIRAFASTGVSARWREWERSSGASPAYVRGYGSPTVLVDGRDVAGLAPQPETRTCRLYSDERGGLSPVPSLESICTALRSAAPAQSKSRWRTALAPLPAIGAALLPKLTCPLCFPAYAALLGAFGLGFVNYTPYLVPLTAVFLFVALGSLGLRVRRSGNFAALVLGIAASILIMLAKFRTQSDWLTAAVAALLIVAVVFGGRNKAHRPAFCPGCTERSEARSTMLRRYQWQEPERSRSSARVARSARKRLR